MANIKDVARLAGVSTATVSNVLNQSRPVSEDKKRRVLDAAEKLNYIPSANARDLKRKATKTIGIILTDIKSQFHADLFNTVSSVIQERGYTLRVAFSNEVIRNEQFLLENMFSQGVDGIILITCQTEKESMFWKKINAFQTPVIFIERKIPNVTVNYAGFNNYSISYELTSHLLKKGYRKMHLLCGMLQYSSESDYARGFSDAYKDASLDFDPDIIHPIDMIKESAMETCLSFLHDRQPEVILGTSREITEGIMLAAQYNGIRVPGQMLVIGAGEENWDHHLKHSGDRILSRSAVTLGEIAAERLFYLIESPVTSDPFSIELEDFYLEGGEIPPASEQNPSVPALKVFRRNLELLLIDGASRYPLLLMLPHFEQENEISVHATVIPQNQMLRVIQEMYSGKGLEADVFMYDSHWLNYLVQNYYLAELSEFLERNQIDLSRVEPELHQNFRIDNRVFGVPYTGGSQQLFYRQDLFEDPAIAAAYSRQHQISLRAPRTWTEFNHIARFFTKKYNPDSPTEFGTTFGGKTDEVLSCEILIRLYALNGALWDKYGQPTFDSSANCSAYKILSETIDYSADDFSSYTLDDTVHDFIENKAAMLIAFSEYAPEITKTERQEFQRRIGYDHIPGRQTVSAGYSFGLNPFSSAREEAFTFFNWICNQDTSYLMTLFSGAPQFTASYHNHELKKLYPWLYYTEKSIQFSQKRIPPMRNDRLVIPPNTLEHLICTPLRRMRSEGLTAEEALADAQAEAVRVFTMYGTPKRSRF